jgi:arylsulfatase A
MRAVVLIYVLAILALAHVEIVSASSLPNVLIVLVDDMGYGDPGCYNNESKIPTPNIDRLAREGMRFTDAHSAGPLCHPSRYGLITGRYPFRTDISKWPKQPVIEDGQLTIGSLLREQGYKTAMVGKWHLGFAEKGYDNVLAGGPIDRGFEQFLGMRASTDIPPYFFIRGDRAIQAPIDEIQASNSPGWSPIQGRFWRAGGIAPDLKLEHVLTRFTDEAIKTIKGLAASDTNQKPFCLYLAYTGPHTPWLPSNAFVGKSGAGMYGDFAMMVDYEIGRVLQVLDEAKLVDNTLVLFTSDNGPTWYPNDVKKFGHDCAGGLRGMKSDAWEGGHRVPFIVRWPKVVSPGSVSKQTICFTDVLATLANVVGTNLEGSGALDSTSFLSVLAGTQAESVPIRGPIVMRAGSSNAMMIRSGPWKLIDQLGSGGFSQPARITPAESDPKGQLYNLETDLREQTNLYLQNPEIVSKLTQELTSIVGNSN